jgi:hypothetical protein
VATFASVRSANRAARISEAALREQRRPVLVSSRMQDPEQKIAFGDGRYVRVAGGQAGVERDGDVVYLVLSLRNVGAGIAVLRGWHPWPHRLPPDQPHADLERFRGQVRDLIVPPGDIGLWQGALRDPAVHGHDEFARAVDARQQVLVELLYSDQVGEQRSIARFLLDPTGDGVWLSSVVRQWDLEDGAAR